MIAVHSISARFGRATTNLTGNPFGFRQSRRRDSLAYRGSALVKNRVLPQAYNLVVLVLRANLKMNPGYTEFLEKNNETRRQFPLG